MELKKAIDNAFGLFQKKNHAEASAAFRKLLEMDDLDLALKCRIKKTIGIIERLEHSKDLKSEAEPILRITYLINKGKQAEAKHEIENSGMNETDRHFFLAELAMEGKDRETAANHLKQSLELRPMLRGYAINLENYAPLAKHEMFSFLLPS